MGAVAGEVTLYRTALPLTLSEVEGIAAACGHPNHLLPHAVLLLQVSYSKAYFCLSSSEPTSGFVLLMPKTEMLRVLDSSSDYSFH